MKVRLILTALVSGLIMGLGLVISGMVNPNKVLGFLDIFCQWDPALAFVMIGALGVYFPAYFIWIKPKEKTVFNQACQIPKSQTIDKRLVVGALLFGIGWGLSGICPGPALVNLTGGSHQILVFVFSMLLGMIATRKILKM